MCTFAHMLIFCLWFFKVFKIFLVLITLTYCYIFDLQFICLGLEQTESLLFTFVLKKPYFSGFLYKLFNIYLSLPLSTCQFRVSVWKQTKNGYAYVCHFDNFITKLWKSCTRGYRFPIRPLAFVSSFSVNRRIRISLAISLHFVWISSTNFSFFIFQYFTQKFRFFNLKSYWILKYLHTQEIQRATAHLNVWTNILLFCFMYGYNQYTKIYWRNQRGGNLFSRFALPSTSTLFINLSRLILLILLSFLLYFFSLCWIHQ